MQGQGPVSIETAKALVESKPWHHQFEIIPGVRTKGNYDPAPLWATLDLPKDLTGKSLADVGASNGYFSFEAHKRGARVVAFDFRHKDNSGFGLAQHINGLSDIEHHQANILDLSSHSFGQFDFVLALGLFYHVADPYRALANCAGLCREWLLIESYCIDRTLLGSKQPVMKFLSDPLRFPEHRSVDGDRSNFWGFTSLCLRRMVEDVGFEVQQIAVKRKRVIIKSRRTSGKDVRLPLAYECVPHVAAGEDRNDPRAWAIF